MRSPCLCPIGVNVELVTMFVQVIPEGAGPVKSLGRSFFLAFDILAGASR